MNDPSEWLTLRETMRQHRLKGAAYYERHFLATFKINMTSRTMTNIPITGQSHCSTPDPFVPFIQPLL